MKFRPCFKMILVEEVKKEKTNKKSSVLLPEETIQEEYKLCKVLDYSRDCVLFKSLVDSEERYILCEGHLIKKVEVDGEVYSLLPEHGVVMVSSK